MKIVTSTPTNGDIFNVYNTDTRAIEVYDNLYNLIRDNILGVINRGDQYEIYKFNKSEIKLIAGVDRVSFSQNCIEYAPRLDIIPDGRNLIFDFNVIIHDYRTPVAVSLFDLLTLVNEWWLKPEVNIQFEKTLLTVRFNNKMPTIYTKLAMLDEIDIGYFTLITQRCKITDYYYKTCEYKKEWKY